MKEVRKRGNQIKIRFNDHNLSVFDTQNKKIFKELENVTYNDLEYLVYGFQLKYDEVIDILKLNKIPTKNRLLLEPGNVWNNRFKQNPEYILPDNVKVSIIIDDIRLKSSLKISQTSTFHQ